MRQPETPFQAASHTPKDSPMTPEQIQNKPFFYKPFYIPPKADLFAQRALRFQ